MEIHSPSFQNQQMIPTKFTCQGADVSPELQITDVPEGAVSLALISDDPDAPNGDWVHWLIWNIPPHTNTIPEATDLKFAIQGTTSFGNQGYGGPCPPSGTHRYFFKLYALDTELDLAPTSDKQALLQAMEGHIIEKSELMGTYAKN